MTGKVVLVPGFGCDGDSMLELRNALEKADRGFSTAVVDLAGAASLEDMVGTVEQCIGSDEAILVGLSMGGWISQAVAARAPERVSSLVLLSSWTRAPESFLRIVRSLHEEISGGQALSSLRPVVASGFADHNRADELADRWVAMVERVGPETFLAEALAILEHPDVDDDAGNVKAPTLWIAGTKDQLIPPDSQQADSGNIPRSTFITIEGSGHNIVWEAPDATNDAVLDWLDKPTG